MHLGRDILAVFRNLVGGEIEEYTKMLAEAREQALDRMIYDAECKELDLPRSFNNGAKWSRWEQYTQSVFSTLEHSFANEWVGKAQVHHQINGYYAPLGSIQGRPNATTGKVIRQIPDPAALKVAHNIEQLKGVLLDEDI